MPTGWVMPFSWMNCFSCAGVWTSWPSKTVWIETMSTSSRSPYSSFQRWNSGIEKLLQPGHHSWKNSISTTLCLWLASFPGLPLIHSLTAHSGAS